MKDAVNRPFYVLASLSSSYIEESISFLIEFMTINIFSNKTYLKLTKYWLSSVLLILPFQHTISKTITIWDNEKLTFVKYLDEFTIIVFLPLAIAEFIRNKEIRDWSYIVLLLPILVICVGGLISGIVNGNPLHITVIGTVEYIRFFFVIFIFAAFFREASEFEKIFRILLVVALFITGIAFIQELWAISSKYLSEEYGSSKIYLGISSILPDYSHYMVRLGIYRIPSLMHSFLFMGLYTLLILTIYLFTVKKVKIPVFFVLFLGIFVSVSRMAYMGLLFVFGAHWFRNKGKRMLLIIAIIPVVLLMFKLSALRDFNLLELSNVSESGSSILESGNNAISYRKYSRDIAMRIWSDHPLCGVGPGMFGGIVSTKVNSHIYEMYAFGNAARTLLYSWGSIDQFWPIVMAETGIIGTMGFAALLIILYVVLFLSKKRAVSQEIKGLFAGLQIFEIVILMYSAGHVINIPQVIFPFFAFVGMGLGCLKANRI